MSILEQGRPPRRRRYSYSPGWNRNGTGDLQSDHRGSRRPHRSDEPVRARDGLLRQFAGGVELEIPLGKGARILMVEKSLSEWGLTPSGAWRAFRQPFSAGS
jgi:hypothetical protein